MKEWLSIEVWTFLAGAAGSFVATLRFFTDLTWVDRLITFLGGLAAAHFLTRPVIRVFELHTIDEGPGTGFILGLFGMSIAAATLRILRDLDYEKVAALFPWRK